MSGGWKIGPQRADQATPDEKARHVAEVDQERSRWADRIKKGHCAALITVYEPGAANGETVILAPEVSVGDTVMLIVSAKRAVAHFEKKLAEFIEAQPDVQDDGEATAG